MRPPYLTAEFGRSPRPLLRTLLRGACLLAVACGGSDTGDSSGGVTPPSGGTGGPNTGVAGVTAVALTPTTETLTVGDTATILVSLTTVGTPPSGGWTTTWQSSDATIASVSSSGAVIALAAGTATISATAGGKTASATVTVTAPAQPAVTSVTLSPSLKSYVAVGLKLTFSATVASASPPPTNGWTIIWTSSDPTIATVAGGVVTAIAPGAVTISATSGGKTGSTPLEVLPQPGAIDLHLDPPGDFSLQLGDKTTLNVQMTLVGTLPPGGLATAWTSSNPAIATVATSGAQGLVTAVSLGTTTVTVTAYGKTASVVVTVVAKSPPPPAPPATVTGLRIQPAQIITWPGGYGSVVGVVTSTPPVVFFDWPIVWTMGDSSVAKLDPIVQNSVSFAPLALGRTTLTAKLAGFTAVADIYVADVTSLALSPATMTLAVAAQGTFSATVATVGPLPPSGWPITWGSSSPLVATVSSTGVVTAIGAGKARLTAEAHTKFQTAVVTVTGPLPTLVLTSPDTIKGSIVQGAQGYSLVCSTITSVAMTGPGEVRWTKTLASVAGSAWSAVTDGSFYYPVLTAGVSPAPFTHEFVSLSPVATVAEVTAFTGSMQFHYAINATDSDVASGLAADYFVARSYVCIP